MRRLFQRHIALPQDHGSWVFLLSPLLIGLFASSSWRFDSFLLILTALLVFLLRQPITIVVKVYAGRRPRSDLAAAYFWALTYGLSALLCLAGLVALGHASLLLLSLPAIPLFAWHLWLVRQRKERRQAGLEILASGVLALSAPAALWLGSAEINPQGWLLWLLTWLQSAASIVYAYLRLEQREWKAPPPLASRFRSAARALAYSTFNLTAVLLLGVLHVLPTWLWSAYFLQAAETLWGASHPAISAKPTHIGLRQLIVSALFSLIFIICWRL